VSLLLLLLYWIPVDPIGVRAQQWWRPQGDSNPRYRRERARESDEASGTSGRLYYSSYYDAFFL
jgi:hypothetical protein